MIHLITFCTCSTDGRPCIYLPRFSIEALLVILARLHSVGPLTHMKYLEIVVEVCVTCFSRLIHVQECDFIRNEQLVCHATLFDLELKMGEHNMSHPMSKWQNLGLFINMKQLLDQTTAGVEIRRLKGVVYITHIFML